MSQTTIQNADSIKFGSAKMEVSTDGTVGAVWEDMGAGRSFSAAESYNAVKIDSDNAGVVKDYVNQRQFAISGELLEVDFNTLKHIRGALDEVTTVAGAETTEDQVLSAGNYSEDVWYEFAGQNDDGSEPLVNTADAETDGDISTSLITSKVGDEWGFIIPDGTLTSGTGQSITINITYTPTAKVVVEGGGTVSLSRFQVRLTNTDADGKEFSVRFPYCKINEGMEFSFASDDADDANTLPISILAETDPVSGKTYIFEDEQSV